MLELYGDWKKGLLSREEMLGLVRITESYVFRRFLCGIPTNSMNKTFAGLCKGIDKSKYFRSAQAEFLKLSSYRKFPGNAETAQMLADKDVYNTPRCSYLLERLENHFHLKEPIRAANYTIEHVMPQSLTSEWKAALGPDAEEVHGRLLHTLGNLTLTGYNSELSCRPFKDKLEKEEGGFLSSPLALNRYVRKQSEWGRAQIEARAAELAQVVLQVWPEPDATTLTEFQMEEVAKPETYTLDHYPQLSGAIGDIYLRLEEGILALHPEARRECKKLYIAFKLETNFVDIIPLASKLLLVFNLGFDEVDDPKGRCRDITGLGRWGNGDVELAVSDISQVDYALEVAAQSLATQVQE